MWQGSKSKLSEAQARTMRHRTRWLTGLLGLACAATLTANADPPFAGTAHDIDPAIITSADPSSLLVVAYAGRGTRTVFDRRPNAWIDIDAYLFNARFDDGSETEMQVNPEFESASEAEYLSGRGTLEEALLHEAAHASLDPLHRQARRWLEARQADGTFISAYARDYPDREDIAESVIPWIAVRYRRDRIRASVADTIVETMPNRMAFFDSLELGMRPLRSEQTLSLFMSAANPTQEGFMRIINHSDSAGTVRIEATDDAGRQAGPVQLTLEARSSVHLNSGDLESGNSSKGLPDGIGAGTGNWRLRLDSGLNIEALAYVRTADGFVTSMHDLVVGFGRRHHVPIFNPASNYRQQSVLRVINVRRREGQLLEGQPNGDQSAATVEIVGFDDNGERAPTGDVRLTLMPGEARMITAQLPSDDRAHGDFVVPGDDQG